MLCKYIDVFGKPRQGIHSYRFLGIALVDSILTIFLAFLLSWLLNKSFIWTLIILFVIGQLMHILFCVDTSFINNALGFYYD